MELGYLSWLGELHRENYTSPNEMRNMKQNPTQFLRKVQNIFWLLAIENRQKKFIFYFFKNYFANKNKKATA
jgi:hypothetical protein